MRLLHTVGLREGHWVHETCGRVTIVGVRAMGVSGVYRGRSRGVVPTIVVGLHAWVHGCTSTVGRSGSGTSVCCIRHPTRRSGVLWVDDARMASVWLLCHARPGVVVLALEQVDPRQRSGASIAHMRVALMARGALDVGRVKVSIEFVLEMTSPAPAEYERHNKSDDDNGRYSTDNTTGDGAGVG